MTGSIGSIRIAAAIVGALAVVPLAVVPVSAQSGFCPTLTRVMADTPNKYLTFKTGQYYEKLQQWDANVQLPGFQGCRIDVEIDNYHCYIERLSHRAADQTEANLIRNVEACIPGVKSTRRSDEKDGVVRSVIEWKTPEQYQVQVVKRFTKARDNDDKIFMYVEKAE
jgi:hypothetical protein